MLWRCRDKAIHICLPGRLRYCRGMGGIVLGVPKVWQLRGVVVLGLAGCRGVGSGQGPLHVGGDGVSERCRPLNVRRHGLVSHGPVGHRGTGFLCHRG